MSSTDSLTFASAGPVLEAGGNEILALDRAFRGWRVESGGVDVFTVRLDGEIPTSRRRYVGHFGQGAVLFSDPDSNDTYRLIAVPSGPVTLREMDAPFFQESRSCDERTAFLASAVDYWVESISAGIFEAVPPKQHVEPPEDGSMIVEGGTPLRSTRGVLWVCVQEGAVRIMGRRDLLVSSESGPFVPVGSAIWVDPASPCRLHGLSTIRRVADGRMSDDLARFYVLLHRAIAVVEADRRRCEWLRIQQKRESDRKVLACAVGHLAKVMTSESPADTARDDLLLKACRIVGKANRIDVMTPLEKTGNDSRGRLDKIAAASRFRTRKVALRGRWWRRDAGALLAVLVADDGRTRAPVALVPALGGRYRLIDPRSGSSVELDEAMADRLDPFAFAFYRPFRNRAVTACEVFKFGAEGCRGDFLTILVMGTAGGVLGLFPPIIAGLIFDTIIPGAARIQLLHLVAALLVCAVASAMFQLVRGFAVLRIESKMDTTVQSAVWDRLLHLPTTFFRRFAAGDLAVRAGGISEIRRLLSGATISSLLSGLFSVLNLALLFYYDARLATWACGMTMTALSVMLAAGYAQLRNQRQVATIQSRLSGHVLQYVTGITKLRVAGAEAKAYERWASGFAEQRRLQFKARCTGNGLATFNAAFSVLSTMAIFGLIFSRGDAVMATGEFIAFSGAYGAFTANMLGMTGAFMAVMLAVPIYEQAEPILQALPEVNESKTDPGPLEGEIEISQVSFRYDPSGEPVLENVSVRAGPGEFVAFVGPSGSGKSTTLRLLLGFEQPESGSIYLDGRDLAGLDIQAVRRQIGVVLQNGSVVTGDLFTNITGSTPATMDDAWEAARMAGLDEDVRLMPMGMHTVVSEGGTTLSGGQRQRLLIARAVVHRPRILYFDEATSALDNRTQAIVSESLERLQATRIVVAHRLSTIINADRIYVFDRGRVVQQGTYATLLEEGGLFTELVRRQIA